MATQKSGCLGQLLGALGALGGPSTTTYPYRRRPRFLTQNEAAVFAMLERANPGWVVFANVHLRDLIEVARGSDRSESRSAFNRISQRQVDFAICDRATFRPVLAIELDESTHDRPSRQKRDDLENEALRSAGLPLLRLRGKYEHAELMRRIADALGAPDPTNPTS